MLRILSVFIVFAGTLTFVSYASAFTVNVEDRKYNLRIIYEKEKRQEVQDLFNKALEKFKKPGTVNLCLNIIDLPWRDSNTYGAFCNYTENERKENIMICASTVATRLKMEKIEPDSRDREDINTLAAFTARYCSGG